MSYTGRLHASPDEDLSNVDSSKGSGYFAVEKSSQSGKGGCDYKSIPEIIEPPSGGTTVSAGSQKKPTFESTATATQYMLKARYIASPEKSKKTKATMKLEAEDQRK